jgi:hypothetical protein
MDFLFSPQGGNLGYVSNQRVILPASTISLVTEEGQYKLTAAHLQPAVMQGLRDSYKDKLNNDSPEPKP